MPGIRYKIHVTATRSTSDSPTVGSTGRGVTLWNLWTPRPLACTVVRFQGEGEPPPTRTPNSRHTSCNVYTSRRKDPAESRYSIQGPKRSLSRYPVATPDPWEPCVLCSCPPRIIRRLAGLTQFARPVIYSPTPRQCSGPAEFAVVPRWPVVAGKHLQIP